MEIPPLWLILLQSRGIVKRNPPDPSIVLWRMLDKLEFDELLVFVLFLLLQEKYQKKQSQGALKAALPRVPYDRNYGMIATGNHTVINSLRGALPPCESPVRIAVGAGAP